MWTIDRLHLFVGKKNVRLCCLIFQVIVTGTFFPLERLGNSVLLGVFVAVVSLCATTATKEEVVAPGLNHETHEPIQRLRGLCSHTALRT